ncbi:hypothetical protein QTP88_002451 [Uroleucon formosanum]
MPFASTATEPRGHCALDDYLGSWKRERSRDVVEIDKRIETQRCKRPPSVHFGTNFWPTWEATSTFPSAKTIRASFPE